MLSSHYAHMMSVKSVLASTSSQRKQIFRKNIGVRFFEMVNPYFNKDVSRLEVLKPEDYVKENSREKALAVARDYDWSKPLPKRLIVAADTVYILDKEVLGRPESIKHNIEMLTKLSGNYHEALTSVTLVYGMEKDAEGEPVFLEKSFFDSTLVKITDLPHKVITEYVKTGEPDFKPGGYSITELGATFVERIHGDYYNIIGLPAYKTAKAICDLLDAKLI